MAFVDIPTRLNSQNIDAAWFNNLRTQGIAVDDLLGGAVPQEKVLVAENPGAPITVASLQFNPATTKNMTVQYITTRKDDVTNATQIGTFDVSQDLAGLVTIEGGDVFKKSDAGIRWQLSGNDVQFTAANFAGGSYDLNSAIWFKATTILLAP